MYNVHWTLHAYYGAAVIYQILFCIYAPLSKRLGKTSTNEIKICAHKIVFFFTPKKVLKQEICILEGLDHSNSIDIQYSHNKILK